MTLVPVAQAIGVDHSSLQRLETGQTPYTQDHLEKLAEIYQCSPADLISVDPINGPSDLAPSGGGLDQRVLRRLMASALEMWGCPRSQAEALVSACLSAARSSLEHPDALADDRQIEVLTRALVSSLAPLRRSCVAYNRLLT